MSDEKKTLAEQLGEIKLTRPFDSSFESFTLPPLRDVVITYHPPHDSPPCVVLSIQGEGERRFTIGVNSMSCPDCSVHQGPFAVHVTICETHARRFVDAVSARPQHGPRG